MTVREIYLVNMSRFQKESAFRNVKIIHFDSGQKWDFGVNTILASDILHYTENTVYLHIFALLVIVVRS